MKKAIILIVILILLIILMSSGSLAIYSQTQALRGQLYTRIFLFKGNEKLINYEFGLSGLSLSPGQAETELYRFEITNAQDASNICDYDMSVNISSAGMSEAASAMKGLSFYLYDETSESSTPVATVSAGELAYGSVSFRANAQKTVGYRLTARWFDNGDSASQTAVAAGGMTFPVKIIVTAQSDI